MIRLCSSVGSVVRKAVVLTGSSTLALSAQALLIVPAYDNTVVGPNGQTMFNDVAAKNAVQFALNEFQAMYSDGVQVNIAFTW